MIRFHSPRHFGNWWPGEKRLKVIRYGKFVSIPASQILVGDLGTTEDGCPDGIQEILPIVKVERIGVDACSEAMEMSP